MKVQRRKQVKFGGKWKHAYKHESLMRPIKINYRTTCSWLFMKIKTLISFGSNDHTCTFGYFNKWHSEYFPLIRMTCIFTTFSPSVVKIVPSYRWIWRDISCMYALQWRGLEVIFQSLQGPLDVLCILMIALFILLAWWTPWIKYQIWCYSLKWSQPTQSPFPADYIIFTLVSSYGPIHDGEC